MEASKDDGPSSGIGSSGGSSGGSSLFLSTSSANYNTTLEMSFIGLLKPEQVLKMITDGGSKLLGLGAFGAVFSGIHLDSAVAVKVMKMQQPNDPDVQAAFQAELEKLMQRPCEYIIGYRGACLEPVKVNFFDKNRKQESTIEGVAIVMELATGGDLEHLLRDKRGQAFKVPLTLFQRMILARDTARGLAWLHCGFDTPIIHRDLACKNIFISNEGDTYHAKLGDLGLAKTIPTGVASDEGEGTCSIRAPEILKNILEEGKLVQYDHRIDLYSFGVVLWEILTRKKAYLGKLFDPWEFVRLVCDEKYREPIPPDTPPRLKNLIEMLWSNDPEARLPEGKNTSWVVDELERVLLDIAIPDEEGRRFWEKYFFKRHTVQWKKFVSRFYKFLGLEMPDDIEDTSFSTDLNDSAPYAPLKDLLISEKAFALVGKGNLAISSPKHSSSEPASISLIKLRCLKELVAKHSGAEGKLYVSMLTFGRFLARVGPLVSPDPAMPNILERIHTLLSNDWFHGDLDNNEALILLKNQQPGTFLVRFSSIPADADLPPPHSYALMIKPLRGEIKKLQIIQSPQTGKYQIADYTYDSLESMIDRICKDLHISTPCPPYPFAKIFTPVKH